MAFKKTNTTKETDVNYEVLEDYGDISTKGNYTLKVRYVKWGNNDPKYDIRAWATDDNGNEKCRKGLTLTGDEVLKWN